MKYEVLTLEKLPTVIPLFVETFNTAPWNEAWTYETATIRLSQMLEAPSYYGIIAYDNANVMGILLGHRKQEYNKVDFIIEEFCVSNQSRGTGIGSKMLAYLETSLEMRDISEIKLLTISNRLTMGFYEKNGYCLETDVVMMHKEVHSK